MLKGFLNRRAVEAGVFVGLVTALGSLSALRAQTPEAMGREIALEAGRRDSGYGDITAELTMVLRAGNGRERNWVLGVSTLEGSGGETRTMVVFERPHDLQGTALLTFAHAGKDDDQWLYMPALKRVKRISPRNRSGSFMGSEFAYEDIGSQEVEKYTYRFLRHEVVDGAPALVVERYPKDANSGYTRHIVWFDAREYRVLGIEYYDRQDSLLKTLRISGYRQYAGRFWRPDEMVMSNHQNGKSTAIHWRDYRVAVGLTDVDFDRSRLGR